MKIILMVLAFFACSFSCLETSSQDIRAERPSGKNWKQVTDLHYMNFNSVKKIKAKVYQIEFCIPAYGGWYYWTDRIHCDSGMTWSLNTRTKEWVGPLTPSDYHKAAASIVCKN